MADICGTRVSPESYQYDIIVFNALGQALYKKEKAVKHQYFCSWTLMMKVAAIFFWLVKILTANV